VGADLRSQIGRRLRRIRKMRGLTQKELANKIVGRLDYTYIGKIERGEQLPSLKVLGKVSEALAVPIGYFFHDEALSYLLPEELRRLSRDHDRALLVREVARMARADLALLVEIVRVLQAHRRKRRVQREADIGEREGLEARRAADWTRRYRTKRAETARRPRRPAEPAG